MKRKYLLPLMVLTLLMTTACATQDTPQPTSSPIASPTASPTASPVASSEASPAASPDAGAGQPAGMELKDGEYTAQVSEEYAKNSGHGWQEYLKITVSGGQVADVEYDAQMDGKLKSKTTKEEYNMDPHPSQWIPQLTQNVKNAKTPDEVDAVSGATSSSETVKKLYAAVLEAAQAGNTAIVTLSE